jgi:DNA-binding response OmpR family regulator
VRQQLHTSTGVQLLSFKETALLALLLAQRNQVLTRQEALLRIWGEDSYYNARSMGLHQSPA